MKKPYFVMLVSQDQSELIPMMDDEGTHLAMFETRVMAELAALSNPMGAHFGYDIFEAGNGI